MVLSSSLWVFSVHVNTLNTLSSNLLEVWVVIETETVTVKTMSHLVGEITPYYRVELAIGIADGFSPDWHGYNMNPSRHAAKRSHTEMEVVSQSYLKRAGTFSRDTYLCKLHTLVKHTLLSL